MFYNNVDRILNVEELWIQGGKKRSPWNAVLQGSSPTSWRGVQDFFATLTCATSVLALVLTFRGSKRISWKLLCVKNCCLCLRNRSIWTSGGTRWSGTLPEASSSSPLWLHAHWETLSGFLCRMKVHMFLTVSTLDFCSTGRARHVCAELYHLTFVT